jgi:hypothetical protein
MIIPDLIYFKKKKWQRKEDNIENQRAYKEHPNLSICHFLFFKKSCTSISSMVTNAMETVIKQMHIFSIRQHGSLISTPSKKENIGSWK